MCLFPPKENHSSSSFFLENICLDVYSLAENVFLEWVTFICWLETFLQSKMRFIIWLLPVIVVMTPYPYLLTGRSSFLSVPLFPLSFTLLSFFPQPSSLALHFSFLSLLCFPPLPIRLSTPDSSPHLSIFLFLCLCAFFMGRNSPSHMGEDQLHGESSPPTQTKHLKFP